MKKTPTIDLHVYLTPEDQQIFLAVRKLMVSLGMPSKIGPQAVIRFALRRAAREK